MALFKVVNNQAQLDAGEAASTDVYGAGIRFTQSGAARVTRFAGTAFNQGIPMSPTGQVAIVDATAGLPAGAIYLNGLPISNNRVCVSLNASSVISSGLPFDSNGALVGSLSGFDTLRLDFTSSTTLDPRITFSRTSNATLTDSNGRVSYAPHNLLTNSEDFEAAAWVKSNASITANAAVAPDGTTTADRLIPALSATDARASQAVTGVADTRYTLSAYGKADAFSSMRVYADNGASSFALVAYNLNTGAVAASATTGGTWTGAASTIENIGNGWYRITLSWLATGAAPTRSQIWCLNTGDGTSGIFIWGAQLNVGALQSYNSTTPKNLLGFTQEFDNAAWTKSNSFVQTNLLTWSEQFNNAAWVLDNSGAVNPVVTADAGIAPNGTVTADRIVLNKTGGTFSRIQQGVITSIGTVYTFSVWMKTFAGGTSNVGIRVESTSANCVVTGDWQRFTVSTTATTLSAAGQILLFDSIVGNDETADILAWGAQLVQGSVPGDYQVTTSAAAAVQYSDPNGTRTADLVNASAGTFPVQVNQNISIGALNTFGVYAKAGTHSFIQLRYTGDTSSFVNFDLSNGSVGTFGGTATGSIQSLGNGWYRCSATNTSTAVTGEYINLVASASSARGASSSWAGTETVLLWGAQLSNSASVDPYVYNPQAAPTSTAYYGPRFDYNPVTLAANGLLIEEQRTNLLTYSEQFDNAAWGKFSGFSVASNTTVAPDGTTTADTVTFTSSSSNTRMNTPSVTAGVTYVFSIWAQSLTGSTGLSIDIGDGTGVNVTVPATLTRISVPVVAGSAGAFIDIVGNGAATMVWWGAQLEAGSFATSYIPTVASQVTRAADNASMLGDNFSTWYNASQGTFYTNGDRIYGGNAYAAFAVARNTATGLSDRIDIALGTGTLGGAGIYRMTVAVGGVAQAELGDLSAFSANTPYKGAIAYAANDFASSVQGGAVNTDTSGSVPSGVNSMDIGNRNSSSQLNGHIRSISYYPTRLPNATLQSITT